MVIGIWYRNFTNHQGALADGTCCDSSGLSIPNCPKNQCDTSFLPCGTFVGGKQCGAYNETSTATMAHTNSFVLQLRIGNQVAGIKGPSLVVNRIPFSPYDIQFSIEAREVTGVTKTPMATFIFLIDWIDTFFSDDLHWRQMILKDAYSELGVDVLRQCYRYYFGPTCSVYCKPTRQYTCLNDGSKNCTGGWLAPDCDRLVPYCTKDLCQHGGNCTNIHLGYVCSCAPEFWGANCETTMTLPNISNPSTATPCHGLSMVNASSNTESVSTTNDGKKIIIVTAVVSAGLVLLGLLVASSVSVTYRMKKWDAKKKVQPTLTPPLSHTDAFKLRKKNLNF